MCSNKKKNVSKDRLEVKILSIFGNFSRIWGWSNFAIKIDRKLFKFLTYNFLQIKPNAEIYLIRHCEILGDKSIN